MKKITLTAMLIGCMAMAAFAAISGLTGKWLVSVKLPDGNVYSVTYEFKINGSQLTGTATAEGTPKTINDGKINGDDFTFSLADDNGSLIKHTGKYYAQGDSVSLNVDYQGTILHTTLARAKN